MNADDIKASGLLSALDAFIADKNLETKGKAIRVLVTDMLLQLGYLPPVSAGAIEGDLVYRSSNGDAWSLATDGAGGFSVIHRANAASAGMETTTPVDRFLQQNAGSPEEQAVRAAMDAAASRKT